METRITEQGRTRRPRPRARRWPRRRPAPLAPYYPVIKEGGVLVSAASPADDAPGTFEVVRLFGQNDPAQLADIVRLIDAGELVVPIAQRLTLDDVPAVHANPPHSGKAIFRS